ncbi:molybdenum cofactor guanylyltransferase [Krasilnikoviella flava]|uniref:Molybdopterin-guanine dinucleotide biosynthesis protein A n=1 Tax=Krasilnikoviella flava TaxID=526729 RepID=A0A1T5I724_9MICO|nr:NTP transferase domain-containing protein [Krasilnikoviella flava]SKC34959.1 Molybdopterin-guanine dinucleotide biosynthesis protein A [Krasilnikoviella flava]
MGPGAAPHVRHDAVVLAGGRATRLGGVPKPTVVLDGATLLDRALAAARDAERTVVVGPDPSLPPGRDVLVAREDPPFGGPVAGLDAGLGALGAATEGGAPAWVLVLAVDVPRAAEAVPLLRAAVAGHEGTDGAYLVREDRAQWLVGLYRRAALRRALDAVAGPDGPAGLAGVPVKRLVAHLSCVEVPDRDEVSADVDTWDDLRRLTVGLHTGSHTGDHTVVAARAGAEPTTPRPPTDRWGGTR